METAPHPVPLLLLEPSLKMCNWDISPECYLVSLGRLGDEFYF